MASDTGDPTKTWVYGKSTPGWYIARSTWNQADATRWQSLGYEVQRSIEKPTAKVAA